MDIRVEALSKSFREHFYTPLKYSVKDLSFHIQEGKTTGFVGLNGAGKTTTIKCLLGFIKPDSGRLQYGSATELSADVRNQIGFLPERPYYYDFLTAREFLKIHYDLSVSDTQSSTVLFAQRMHEVLDLVKLKDVENKKLKTFSKGMLQRIGLAQCLIHDPSVVILDEPMSGLDPDGRILVKGILKKLKASNKTLFFTSHLLSDMEELCDNIVMINEGQLLFEGSLEKFFTLVPPMEKQDLEEAYRLYRQKLEKQGDT